MAKLKLHKNWFADAWNAVDVLSSGGMIALGVFFFYVGPGEKFDFFASIISLFMWMKVLGFIKVFSQQIATFVLMLSTILYDLSSFMGVLGLIIVAFGHAFYLTLGDGTAGVYTNTRDPDDVLNFNGARSTGQSLYLMVLGKLDEPKIFEGLWASTLFFAYSFLVVIVLLNVLIAIVGDR